MKDRGIAPVIILAIIIVVALVAVGIYYVATPSVSPTTTTTRTTTTTPTTTSTTTTTTTTTSTTTTPVEKGSFVVGNTGLPESSDITKYIAIDYMKDMGYEAELKSYEGYDIVWAAVLGGHLDGALGSFNSLLTVVDHGSAAKLVGESNVAQDYALVGASGITSIEDIVGKSIGIEGFGALSHLLILSEAASAGLDTAQLNFVIIGGSGARTAALEAGQVDIAAVHYSQWIYLDQLGLGLELVSRFSGAAFSEGAHLTDEYISDHPDVVVDLNKALIQAGRDITGPRGFEIFQEYSERYELESPEGITLEDLYNYYIEVGAWPRSGGMDASRLDSIIDLSYQNELITERKVTTDYVYYDGVNAALEELGTVS